MHRKKLRGLHRTIKSKEGSGKQSGKKVGKEWFSFHQGRCAWHKARISGKRNDNGIDCRNNRVVSESPRLHLKVCVASIVCRCVLLNSWKMHFRVILKILPHWCGQRLPGSVNCTGPNPPNQQNPSITCGFWRFPWGLGGLEFWVRTSISSSVTTYLLKYPGPLVNSDSFFFLILFAKSIFAKNSTVIVSKSVCINAEVSYSIWLYFSYRESALNA